uniref:(northern house mosquito) hypothetical protein n=1 Tax=Culex pipiens TaxID=7175 RepID=A0A8D8LFI1_CULPI
MGPLERPAPHRSSTERHHGRQHGDPRRGLEARGAALSDLQHGLGQPDRPECVHRDQAEPNPGGHPGGRTRTHQAVRNDRPVGHTGGRFLNVGFHRQGDPGEEQPQLDQNQTAHDRGRLPGAGHRHRPLPPRRPHLSGQHQGVLRQQANHYRTGQRRVHHQQLRAVQAEHDGVLPEPAPAERADHRPDQGPGTAGRQGAGHGQDHYAAGKPPDVL